MTALLKKLLSICQSGWRQIQIALPLQGRIQKFLMGGGGGGGGGRSKLWFTKDRWTFLWQITSHTDGHVFLKLWTPVAGGAEANRSFEGTQKQWHFLISLEFRLVAKCKAHLIKKISQLKSDIRSCRCKNFCLKQASDLGGGRRTLPLDPPLRWGPEQGYRRFFADVTNQSYIKSAIQANSCEPKESGCL